MKRVLVNGIRTSHISVYDRALQYGDGLFETILCHARNLYYWPQHYQRLLHSAKRLKLECPPQDLLLAEIRMLIAADDGSHVVKILLTRGDSERGYTFAGNTPTRRILQCAPLPPDYSALITHKPAAGRLFVCQTQVSINQTLAGLKHLNRLENVLARSEFGDDFMDGVMLNAEGSVIEGVMSNLFAIRDGRFYTPDLSRGGVNGIMREQIMAIIKQLNYSLHIKTMTLTELQSMDALFISNSLIGIRPVSAIGERRYPLSALTQQVFSALLADAKGRLTRV